MRTARSYFAVVLGTLVLNVPLASAQEPILENTFRHSGETVRLGRGRLYVRRTASYARHFAMALETLELGVDATRVLVVGSVSGDFEGPFVDASVAYGRTSLTLRFHERFRLRVTLGLGAVDTGKVTSNDDGSLSFASASQEQGLTAGGGGYLIIGAPLATHIEVGGEYMLDAGYVARVRLGFNVSRRMPMGVMAEVTTFPLDSDLSARVLVDAAYRFASGVRLRWMTGYRSHPGTRGGVSVGFETAYSF